MTCLDLATKGMRCPFCPRLIEKRLARLAGVESVASDYETGRTVVCFDSEWVSMADVVGEIEDAGFAVPTVRHGRAIE